MIQVSFKSSGSKQLRGKIADLRRGLPDEAAAALYLETEIEVTECKRRTPVKTGALRSSIHQEGPIREGRRIYTLIVAGGPAAPYAAQVHEDLDAFHKNGQAKYIESVIRESRPYMAQRIAKRIELRRALA